MFLTLSGELGVFGVVTVQLSQGQQSNKISNRRTEQKAVVLSLKQTNRRSECKHINLHKNQSNGYDEYLHSKVPRTLATELK